MGVTELLLLLPFSVKVMLRVDIYVAALSCDLTEFLTTFL